MKKGTHENVAVVKKKKRKRNQYGVNQYTGPDPREALFFEHYYAIGSPTFSNIYASGIAAGFSESYSRTITSKRPKWFYEYVCQQDLGAQSEEHMKEVMAIPNIQQVIGAWGPMTQKIVVKEDTGTIYKTGKRAGEPRFRNVKVEVPIMKHDTALIKAKNEIAKLVLPAYKPDVYGKKQEKPKFSFQYNVLEIRNEFKPS